MQLTILGEPIHMTDAEYYREMNTMFEECEKVAPDMLHMEMAVLEDIESDYMDGYYSDFEDHVSQRFPNPFENLLELWRIGVKMAHIRLRITLKNFVIPDPNDDGFSGLTDTMMEMGLS